MPLTFYCHEDHFFCKIPKHYHVAVNLSMGVKLIVILWYIRCEISWIYLYCNIWSSPLNISVAKTKNLVANETIQYITSPNYPQFYGRWVHLQYLQNDFYLFYFSALCTSCKSRVCIINMKSHCSRTTLKHCIQY